ncbi:CCA tRNA nucleotidyltransferase [Roseobacter sp. CCS2]|uniref:CCA tRNA nucleotidyltransferase n=1 Tax=Roseobacter sp. CCS2 TaxID=391593 RepID=UPI0000F4019A|nr:CCA tRNA nucleotidyltransferase [Roseobacter sp. CCS2]EBA14160.1 polyA polymerase family protein [Roseobacter sp. CCS2]
MTRISAPWLDDDASQQVCKLLADAGYQAWFVGGCVRNELLDEPVADLDLSTDALPEFVMKLAKAAKIKAIPTGIDHGTVTLIVDDVPFEITTFRRDVATDGRRATVAYSDNMTDDARRRDFTMNALYADADGQIADPLGGLPDLKARRIRFIEDADRRIKEDYLRILRFFRFYAWYGDVNDGPDVDGLAACADNIEGLQSLSVERITAEMLKLLAAPDPAPALASMTSTGALAQVLPGAEPGSLAVLIHLEQSLTIAPNPLRRLAVLGGKPGDALRLSKTQMRTLDHLTSGLSPVEASYRHGVQVGLDVLLVQSASLGQDIDKTALKPIENAAKQVFPLKAADLMPALSGPALGSALKEAETRWIRSGFTLTKAQLLD